MNTQKIYKLCFVFTGLFLSYIHALDVDLVCKAADPKGEEVSISFVPYLYSDGYTNKTVRTCKNLFDSDSCEDGIDNFKYCKDPKPFFFIKTLNSSEKTYVVEDRCNTGYKKFKLVGTGLDYEEIILIDEKMYFQIKNQIWGGSKIESLPALVLSKNENLFNLKIESFTEDHWIEEWNREDIDISFFSVPSKDSISFETSCD